MLKKNYKSNMSLRETERAIKLVKDVFEKKLAKKLKLERISAPIFVPATAGLNDDLNGTERAVRFDIAEIGDYDAEIVHSLAKWKRMALYNYGFKTGEGLYTDMNAIRRDDSIDNTHSVYVDQWDWETVISRNQRNFKFLKATVRKIVSAIVDTQNFVKQQFPMLTTDLKKEVFFITAQELLDRYPDLSAKEREFEITKEYKTVFIMQIGDYLSDNQMHDGRAPDYDDWKLNGDLLFWNEIMSEPLEISSMGIRVDADSLIYQLDIRDKKERLAHEYHKKIVDGSLPFTIGGGIGQSRLCMLILQKLHVGEVQVSVWPIAMLAECEKNNIKIL